jgi:MtN3 and saliva related transmembrane protein
LTWPDALPARGRRGKVSAVAFALPTHPAVDATHPAERLNEWSRWSLVVTILGVAAAAWGVVMALSPLLQIRQMSARGSSADVSLGYFAVLLPGFALWVVYGLARSDLALVVPNVVALLVGTSTIVVARRLRAAARPIASRRFRTTVTTSDRG